MNRRQFIEGLFKTTAAIAVLGPVVLKPEVRVPATVQEKVIGEYTRTIQESIIIALSGTLRNELMNSNYYTLVEASTSM